jgi:hypothetical protein
MASFSECLDNAVSGGEISRDDADRLRADFERLKAVHETGSSTTAEREAKRALEELLKAESDHEKRKARLAIRSINRIASEIRSHVDPRGRPDVASAALDMLEHFGTAGFSSVAGREKAITGMAHAKMEEALHHFRRGAIGGDKTRWNRAQLTNVVREAFGEDSGDAAAKGFARAWEDTHEWLRQRFNAAGGAIGKLENWGLPQRHDARALRKAGRQAWKDYIRPRLDVAKMRHPLTGQAVAERELDGILDEIWTSIATDGWMERQPTRQRFGRGALANQRAEHRFLVFRDADTWLEYQRDFGGGDPFASMMGHVNMMARDIAAMEILGPNPSGTIEWLKQAVRREASLKAAGQPARFAGEGDPLDRAARMERRIDGVWRSIRGELNTPVSTKAANVLGAARSLITASVLGQAALSALSDVGFAQAARKFAGLPQMSVVSDLVKSFRPATRREAVEAGLILDSAAHVFQAQARYIGTLQGPEWANYIADRVLTWSGLTPWTQGARHSFGLAAQLEFGKRAGQAFDQLPDALANTLRRYGISPREWDLIRQAPLHRRDGAEMLRPAEIAERVNPVLAERYLEMILQETEYAVPNASHRSRTLLIDQNQPGTLWGEALRSFAQFKSFGSVVLFLHGARVHNQLAQRETRMAGMAYAGSVLVTTAMLGALSIQLKQLVAGRDPQDMADPAFIGKALLQGGGLGIYGDFLFADLNRFGGGFASTLAGPLVGRANDFWNLTAGNAVQLASGEKTHFGRELVRFARGNVPGGNIWYLKLAAERLLFDQLAWLADPEAQKAFRRQEQYWQRATGQEFFWRPGQARPDRLPALGAAAGN